MSPEVTLEVILARPVVPDEETVVVALHPPSWDPVKQRGTASTFKSPRQSCSRLALLPIEEIVSIFKRDIMGGRAEIMGYGQITVAKIKEIGLSGETKIDFAITADPVDDEVHRNLAHAEIIAFEPDRKAIRKSVTGSAQSKLAGAIEVTVLAP